jgi:hypothetical protein
MREVIQNSRYIIPSPTLDLEAPDNMFWFFIGIQIPEGQQPCLKKCFLDPLFMGGTPLHTHPVLRHMFGSGDRFDPGGRTRNSKV